MKTPTVAQLLAEIETLKQRISALESRPVFQPVPVPLVIEREVPVAPAWPGYPQPWVTCGTPLAQPNFTTQTLCSARN